MTYTTTDYGFWAGRPWLPMMTQLTKVEQELSRIVITDGQVRYRMKDGRLAGLDASIEARARRIMSIRTQLRLALREETGSDEAADHIQRMACVSGGAR